MSKVVHGMTRTRIYGAWKGMKARCYNPSRDHYDRYGGRGIEVCARWHKFANFYEDMGDRPSDQHSIHRINNDGNYEPGNCRWVTQREQCNNKKNNHNIGFEGKTRTVTEWARVQGMDWSTLCYRLSHGWSVGRALTQPVRKCNKS